MRLSGPRAVALTGAPASKPGPTDPRGASAPYGRPLADRPGPDGVTLQVHDRSAMDRAYGAEASTDQAALAVEGEAASVRVLPWSPSQGVSRGHQPRTARR